jgi:hypothetical protein
MIAFWVIAPCSLVEADRYFRNAPLKHWLTSMRVHDAISQKAVIFILTAIRT